MKKNRVVVGVWVYGHHWEDRVWVKEGYDSAHYWRVVAGFRAVEMSGLVWWRRFGVWGWVGWLLVSLVVHGLVCWLGD